MNCEVVARAALCQPATLFYCAMHRTHSRLSPFSQTYRRARRGVRVLFLSRSPRSTNFRVIIQPSLPSPLPSTPPSPRARSTYRARFLFSFSFPNFVPFVPPARGGIFVSSYPSSLDLPFPSLPFPISTGRHRKIALKNASFQRDKRRGSSLSDLSPPPPDFARFAIARINIAIAMCRGL